MSASVALSKVAEVNPRTTTGGLQADDAVDFFPMAAVDAEKTVARASERRTLAQVSKGFTSFQDGDVLLAKITPCFENGKISQATVTTTAAFGSTEFHVVRCGANLDSRYLVHFLRRQEVRVDGERKMTGSGGQRRIPRQFLESLEIPLPPLPEQRRIAAILDKADALRTQRREALAQLERLAQAIFVEMFGDPQVNPMGWSVSHLEDVALKITDGEHQTPARTNSGIKLLSARNVRDGYIDFEDVDYVDEAEYLRISKRCKPEVGDVLISCSGSIGRVAPVETNEPLALVRSAALVKPNHETVTTKFLETWLRTPFMNNLMVNSAKSSSQANLFQAPIRALPIFVPPKSYQVEFGRRISAQQLIKSGHQSAVKELEALFASLQHRAFRGEL